MSYSIIHCIFLFHRVLMESLSNDSRDSGNHRWNSRYSNLTVHYCCTVLLQTAGETLRATQYCSQPTEIISCLCFALLYVFLSCITATLAFVGVRCDFLPFFSYKGVTWPPSLDLKGFHNVPFEVNSCTNTNTKVRLHLVIREILFYSVHFLVGD